MKDKHIHCRFQTKCKAEPQRMALRSTRLGGRLVNLKEEKPGKIISDSIEVQMAMGAQVLWEGSRTFGRQSSQVKIFSELIQ